MLNAGGNGIIITIAGFLNTQIMEGSSADDSKTGLVLSLMDFLHQLLLRLCRPHYF